MREEQSKVKKRNKIILLHITIIVAIIIYMLILQGRCLLRVVTTLPCPGCGLTRAWLSAFSLDFERAFQYHPLFLFVPIMLFIAFHYKKFLPKAPIWLYNLLMVIFGLILLGTFVARLILGVIP